MAKKEIKKEEDKIVAPEKQEETSTQNSEKPKKKHRLLKFIIILFILGLLALGGYFLWYYYFSGRTCCAPNPNSVRFSGELSPKTPKADDSKKVTKALGPAGGVLQVESGDFLYTLTVPPEALILPTNISLAPLTETPITNYAREDLGKGVLVEPSSHFLNQIAFLTVEKAKKSSTEPEWGRCNIGSRGYDAEICAGESDFPFNYGVDPGKVGLFAEEGHGVAFMPTIITGDDNIVSVRIWNGGAFFFDKVSNGELSQLAAIGQRNSSDLSSEVEPIAQIMATGQSLDSFKDKIKDFKRSKSSYPRTLAEAAYLAAAIGDEAVAKGKVEEFLFEYNQNFAFIRGSYLPWPSYFSTYHQLEVSLNVKPESTSLIPTAYAGSKKGKVKPVQKPWKDPFENVSWQSFLDIRKKMIAEARATFEKKNLSDCEKIGAVETLLIALADVTQAEREQMKKIVQGAAKCCSTKEMCQSVVNAAKKLNDSESQYNAEQKIKDIEAKSKKNCTPGDDLVHKQGLADYGQNEPCEAE